MAKHIIYIPGIGDHRPHGQNIAIQLFRIFGIKPHYFALGWNKNESYKVKQNKLVNKIKNLRINGNTVYLIGVSAGASAVINTYAQNKNDISKVICVCGKINKPESVDSETFKKNPDFKESVFKVKESIDTLSTKELNNIMSIHPWRDQVVPINETLIKNAHEKLIPGWGHVSGIFFAATYGIPIIARFVKSNDT